MTNLFAGEPAAWADLGLLELRVGDHEAAARDLEKATKLAPENGAIEGLSGLLESHRGRYAEAIAHFRRAVRARIRNDLEVACFSLLHELERLREPGSEAEPLHVAGELVDRALRERARASRARPAGGQGQRRKGAGRNRHSAE